MDKEKNSEKAQKKDIEVKSYHFSWFGVTLVITSLMLLRIYMDEPIADLMLIVMTQITASAFYQFMKSKTTYYLFFYFRSG